MESPVKRLTDFDSEEIEFFLKADDEPLKDGIPKKHFKPKIKIENSLLKPMKDVAKEEYINNLNFSKAATLRFKQTDQTAFLQAIDEKDSIETELTNEETTK